MFLIDVTTQAVPRAKKVAFNAFQLGITIYAGVLKPLPRREAMYMGISAEIARTKNLTVQERVQMQQYAAQLLQGNEELLQGMGVGMGCRVRGMMAAESSHYRSMHPVLARAKVAA